jgi:hypothetical protein
LPDDFQTIWISYLTSFLLLQFKFPARAQHAVSSKLKLT